MPVTFSIFTQLGALEVAAASKSSGSYMPGVRQVMLEASASGINTPSCTLPSISTSGGTQESS